MKIVVFVLSIMLARYGFAAELPAKQSSPKAASRVGSLNTAVEHFGLHLTFRGKSDKSYYSLILSVKGGWILGDRFDQQARITTKQAEKIIDCLGTEGFLDRAVEADNFVEPTKPGYTMRVHIDDAGYYEDLGWGLRLSRGAITGRPRLLMYIAECRRHPPSPGSWDSSNSS